MNTEQKLNKIREKCVERICNNSSNAKVFYPPDAISGWKATIAACDSILRIDDFESREAKEIIAAWEGLV